MVANSSEPRLGGRGPQTKWRGGRSGYSRLRPVNMAMHSSVRCVVQHVCTFTKCQHHDTLSSFLIASNNEVALYSLPLRCHELVQHRT